MSSGKSPASRLAARYGADEGIRSAPWNPILDTLLAHRSVRSYLPTPLPSHTIPTLVAAAQSAPSSSNLQSWSVVAIQDPERKARLSVHAGNQAFIRQAPLFLVWLADLSRNERIGRADGKTLDGLNYIETLFLAIIDAGLAAQNAVVAAESLGLGAVYVGAIRNHPERVAVELGLPPKVLPVFGLCVGYPDTARPANVKPRLPQVAVLHHETYDAEPQLEAAARYDQCFRRYQDAESLEASGWIERTLQRLETKEALSGRDRMREAVGNLGFEVR